MKWLVALACLSCTDSEPRIVAEADDQLGCIIMAERAALTAAKLFPPGTQFLTTCIGRAEGEEQDELYPQRGGR